MVPDYGLESEDVLRNRVNPIIRITVWRSPVLRYPATRRIVNDPHRVAKLAKDLLVGERCHVRMRPRVHSDVVLEVLERLSELLRVEQDVLTDEEMCCPDAILFEECVERVGRLDNSDQKAYTTRTRDVETHAG